MPVVISAFHAPASAALLASPEDKTIVQSALETLKSTPGVLKVYYGIQVEERKHAYIQTVWESEEAYTAFISSTDLTSLLSKIHTAAPTVVLFKPTTEPLQALAAPTTEFAVAKLKAGQDYKTFKGQVLDIARIANLKPDNLTAHWGTVGSDGLSLMIGWRSFEEHMGYLQSNAELYAVVGAVMGISDVDMSHINLIEYVSAARL